MSKIEFQRQNCYFRFFLILSKRILLHYIAFDTDIYVLRVELLTLILNLCTVNEVRRYFFHIRKDTYILL